MDDIFVLDGLIPKNYANMIEERVTENKFPWYFNKHLVTDQIFTDEKDLNHVGHNHFLYEDRKVVSPFFEFIHPLILTIADQKLFDYDVLERARFNLTQKNTSSTREYHLPHIDSEYPHWIAIYYVNDSDGDTHIFEEKTSDFDHALDIETMLNMDFHVKQKVTPKKGRVLVFDGRYYHTSSFCKENPYRVVLNINYGKIF